MGGSKRTFNIVNPAEPVDPVAVKAAMDTIVAEDIFNEGIVSIDRARLTERNVDVIELPMA